MRAIFLCEVKSSIDRVYSAETVRKIKKEADLDEKVYDSKYVRANPGDFKDVAFVFSSWGMPRFSEDEIRAIFPALKGVFYAAGSVQGFAREFLKCGVRVFSAWAANAVPVAEYAVSQIVLSAKGFFRSALEIRETGNYASGAELSDLYPGNYDIKIGVFGVGMVGTQVVKRLKTYKYDVLVFDPFLPDEKAEALGVRKTTLEEIFFECTVISNHMADNKNTRGMLGYDLFSKMLPNATFINTGRGAQVIEDDLVRFLRERPDVFAILDVTYPEPPPAGSELYGMKNVILTPHIAGSKGNEVHRMSEYMFEEFMRCKSGEDCKWEVSLKMLETMA